MVTVCHHAANFQRAMAKDIRMQEANSSDYVHGDVDSHELLSFMLGAKPETMKSVSACHSRMCSADLDTSLGSSFRI